MIWLIAWNIVLTVICIGLVLRLTVWRSKWPSFFLSKDGLYFAMRDEWGGIYKRILPWGKDE